MASQLVQPLRSFIILMSSLRVVEVPSETEPGEFGRLVVLWDDAAPTNPSRILFRSPPPWFLTVFVGVGVSDQAAVAYDDVHVELGTDIISLARLFRSLDDLSCAAGRTAPREIDECSDAELLRAWRGAVVDRGAANS